MNNFETYKVLRAMEDLALEKLEDFSATPEDIMEILDFLDIIEDNKIKIRRVIVVDNKRIGKK